MAQPPIPNYLNTSYTVNRSQADQAIYLELQGDSRFPSVSVTRFDYPDSTQAFPGNANVPPLTSTEVFPKFAVLNYIVNPEDIVWSLLAQDGFVFADPSSGQVNGTFSTIQVVSACRFQGLTATTSTVGNLTAFDLPQNFSFNGPITNFKLAYGAIIAYKNN